MNKTERIMEEKRYRLFGTWNSSFRSLINEVNKVYERYGDDYFVAWTRGIDNELVGAVYVPDVKEMDD